MTTGSGFSIFDWTEIDSKSRWNWGWANVPEGIPWRGSGDGKESGQYSILFLNIVILWSCIQARQFYKRQISRGVQKANQEGGGNQGFNFSSSAGKCHESTMPFDTAAIHKK